MYCLAPDLSNKKQQNFTQTSHGYTATHREVRALT
jgi:hypothetical protein